MRRSPGAVSFRDDLQERRLAAPARSEDHQGPAVRDPEAQIPDGERGLPVGECLADIDQIDARHVRYGAQARMAVTTRAFGSVPPPRGVTIGSAMPDAR